jgi:hypothetical protein
MDLSEAEARLKEIPFSWGPVRERLKLAHQRNGRTSNYESGIYHKAKAKFGEMKAAF